MSVSLPSNKMESDRDSLMRCEFIISLISDSLLEDFVLASTFYKQFPNFLELNPVFRYICPNFEVIN